MVETNYEPCFAGPLKSNGRDHTFQPEKLTLNIFERYSIRISRVGFFSSVFVNRTSNTPFLYNALDFLGSTM